MLAQVYIDQTSDILAYLIYSLPLFPPLQLALLPEPAIRTRDAQKAAP